MSERERLLRTIQVCEFALVELNLFLNTHPTDKNALANYSKFQELLMQAKKTYTEKYGPLMASDYNGGPRWQWVDNPWPWEMESRV